MNLHSDLIGANRRTASDRRARPTTMWSRYAWFGGRRRAVRRGSESAGAIVDVHDPLTLLLVLSVIALNILDMWFTLLYLTYGGIELNPFIRVVLELGGHPWPFLVLKVVGVGVACAFLTLTKHFRPARIGLLCVAISYAALLGWHLYLLTWLDSLA